MSMLNPNVMEQRLIDSSVALDFSYIKQGYVEVFDLGDGMTRMIEVTSNKRRGLNASLQVVDLKVTDALGELEDVTEYTLETSQADDMINNAKWLSSLIEG